MNMLSFTKKTTIIAIVIIILLLIAGAMIYQTKIKQEPQHEFTRGFELLYDDFYKLSDRDIEMYVNMAIRDELISVISVMEEVEDVKILIELPDEKWPTEKSVSLAIRLVEGKKLDRMKTQKIIQLVSATTNVTKERITMINSVTGDYL